MGREEMTVQNKNPASVGPGAGVSQAQPQAFSLSPGAQGQAPMLYYSLKIRWWWGAICVSIW